MVALKEGRKEESNSSLPFVRFTAAPYIPIEPLLSNLTLPFWSGSWNICLFSLVCAPFFQNAPFAKIMIPPFTRCSFFWTNNQTFLLTDINRGNTYFIES